MPPSEQYESPKRYEVTVATPEQYRALAALGLDMRRVASDIALEDEAFWATSQALFQTDIYGRGATRYVHLLGDAARSTVAISSEGADWNFDQPGFSFRFDLPNNPDRITEPKDYEDHLRRALAEPLTPFPLSVDNIPGKTAKLRITPGTLTVESLAAFVSAKQYPHHELHGTIGKTLDVLTHTAKLASSRDTSESLESDFLTQSELEAALQESGIGTVATDTIKRKIDSTFRSQLSSGRPGPKGEVVFEGRFQLTRTEHDATVKYDKIARASLGVIALDYTRNTQAKMVLLALSS